MTGRVALFLLAYTLCVLTVIGCANVPVYPYYGLLFASNSVQQADVGRSIADLCYESAQLKGNPDAGGWKDLPFTECKPDTAVTGKCWVERSADHFAKQGELDKCRSDLR